jgi:drug/metabolite transporter (DMT)-like permease
VAAVDSRGGLSRAAVAARLGVVAAACGYAFNGPLSRLFYDDGGEPMTLVTLRTVVAAGAFALWFAWGPPRRPSRADVRLIVPVGLVQMAYTAALVFGFDHAPVALVVLLFYTYPLLVTLGAVALFGERLSASGLALIVVGAAGLVLTVGAPSSVTAPGLLFGLAAGAGNAVTILANRALLQRGLRVVDIAALTYAAPALLSLVLLATRAVPLPPATTASWASALAFSTIGTVVPYVLFYRAVAVIGASLAALIATAEPIIALFLAYLLLGEHLGVAELVGAALIVAAIVGLAGVPRVTASAP